MASCSDIFGNVEVAGMEIPIVGEARIICENGRPELDYICNIKIDGDLREKLTRDQYELVMKTVNGLNEKAFTESEIERAIESADAAPDYDDNGD